MKTGLMDPGIPRSLSSGRAGADPWAPAGMTSEKITSVFVITKAGGEGAGFNSANTSHALS